MTGGGLIQLLTVGVEDAPLILNPEITFFKTIYRRYTNFALEQIIKPIGTKRFGTYFQYKVPNVNDLLSGFQFIIDIPFIDVLKTVTTSTTTTTAYDINELSVIYSSTKTYLLFEETSMNYYLVPETFFNLSSNDRYYSQVDGITLEQNLLAGLNLLGTNNYGIEVASFQLKESSLNQLLPVLRLNFNNWFEFWLKIFDKNDEFIYFTNIVSQLNLVSDLNAKLNLILYDGYINYNVFNQYRNYLDFKNEIKNYEDLWKKFVNSQNINQESLRSLVSFYLRWEKDNNKINSIQSQISKQCFEIINTYLLNIYEEDEINKDEHNSTKNDLNKCIKECSKKIKFENIYNYIYECMHKFRYTWYSYYCLSDDKNILNTFPFTNLINGLSLKKRRH
jgi:hypothetical protein